jgi:hypothetical protein
MKNPSERRIDNINPNHAMILPPRCESETGWHFRKGQL